MIVDIRQSPIKTILAIFKKNEIARCVTLYHFIPQLEMKYVNGGCNIEIEDNKFKENAFGRANARQSCFSTDKLGSVLRKENRKHAAMKYLRHCSVSALLGGGGENTMKGSH